MTVPSSGRLAFILEQLNQAFRICLPAINLNLFWQFFDPTSGSDAGPSLGGLGQMKETVTTLHGGERASADHFAR